MNVSPFSRSCAVAGCSAPVARAGRCAAHGCEADQTRGLDSDRIHKRLYASARWRQTRAAVLAAHPLCQCADCQTTGAVTVATVVHHRRVHHGDPDLFFDRENLQPLSKPCHDRLTGRHRGLPKSTARPAPRPCLSAARETPGSDKGV